MKHYFTLLLICCPMLVMFAQKNTTDAALITETIENYFYGYIERDGDKLYKAFDTENGTIKISSSTNEEVTGYKNGYFKDIIPKWANRKKLSEEEINHCKLTILAMDIAAPTIASAKMKMEVGDNTYIDILSLQKINGVWKITNKIYISL